MTQKPAGTNVISGTEKSRIFDRTGLPGTLQSYAADRFRVFFVCWTEAGLLWREAGGGIVQRKQEISRSGTGIVWKKQMYCDIVAVRLFKKKILRRNGRKNRS